MSERRKQIIANRRNLVQLAYASLTLCTSRTVGLDKVSTSQNKTKHNKREEKRREKRKEIILSCVIHQCVRCTLVFVVVVGRGIVAIYLSLSSQLSRRNREIKVAMTRKLLRYQSPANEKRRRDLFLFRFLFLFFAAVEEGSVGIGSDLSLHCGTRAC